MHSEIGDITSKRSTSKSNSSKNKPKLLNKLKSKFKKKQIIKDEQYLTETESLITITSTNNLLDSSSNMSDKDDEANEEIIVTTEQPLQQNPSVPQNDKATSLNIEKDYKDTDPLHSTSGHQYKGGHKGHIFRRVYHVCVFSIIPILFYWFFEPVSKAFHISAPKILSAIIILQIIAEALRIKFRFIIFGMREYERDQICAQAWGTVSTCIVFLLAYPRIYSVQPVFKEDHDNNSQAYSCYAQIGLPIIWSLGIGDPLIGELKKFKDTIDTKKRCIIAWFVLVIIYIISFLWCGTPWFLIIIMPPIAVAAEYPSLKIIDDNGMMLLVPLLVSMILEPWFRERCDQILY